MRDESARRSSQSAFQERLQGPAILADGGMGTELYAAGVPLQRCLDELNLSQPALIRDLHLRYLAAGAELIEANTFGGNRMRLARHGVERVREVNLRGVQLAREATTQVERTAFVAAAIGPIGQQLAPVGSISLAQARSCFAEQIQALLEGEPDVLLFETFADLRELSAAIAAAQYMTDVPIVAQMTFTADGRTPSGESPQVIARSLEELGVAAVGVNCGVGPQLALDVAQAMGRAARLPVAVQPNAGFPRREEGRIVYQSSPAYFADYARRFSAAGVKLIGGCCGTTPAHVQAMHEALVGPPGGGNRRGDGVTGRRGEPRLITQSRRLPVPPSDQPQSTRLATRLSQRSFVVSVEIEPARSADGHREVEAAQAVQGADCVAIGDPPIGQARMSSLALATLVQAQAGVETILHVTPRDRSLVLLLSELLGAHALNLRNVVALTGDPFQLGEYPQSSGIWDVESVGLIGALARLNAGIDSAGASMGFRTNFLIGCSVTPVAEDWPSEHASLQRKLDAGAQYVVTQPVFDMEQLERLLENLGVLPVPLIVGVLPLQSSRHAEFVHNEMAGIGVPGWIRERLRQAGDHGPAEGLEIAAEFLDLARPYVAGVNIIVPFGRYEPVINLVQALRGEPQRVTGNGPAIALPAPGPDDGEGSSSRLGIQNSRLGRS